VLVFDISFVAVISSFLCPVLGLARTGLIFTGIQEGTQPGGLTPPGQTKQGIPYHVLSCWVLVGGSWVAETHSRLRSAGGGSGEQLCGLCGLCCVFSSSVSLLLLFPLLAVLLNCPYPDPPVSACFFPFSSAPRWGEEWPHGAFVASRSQTRTCPELKSKNLYVFHFVIICIYCKEKKIRMTHFPLEYLKWGL